MPKQLTKRTKIIQSGNSLAVVVPAAFARKLGLRPSDPVNFEMSLTRGQITYTFLNIRQLPLV